ncbi:MAG: formylglycine-generating enzyme family protein, partial [Elusimicrobiota bacterium]
DPAADDGMDYRALDWTALDKYNAAFEIDNSLDAEPLEKAEAWRRLARDAPKFSNDALTRAAQWENFAGRKKAADEANRRRLAARDSDWENLVRLTASSATSNDDKTRWTVEFVNAYSRSLGLEPSMTPATAAATVAATMRKAMGARALEKEGGMRWVTISSGVFTMGSDDPDLPDSRPRHRVTLKSFQMAETLVTNKQYKACVAAGACTAAHYSDGECWLYTGKSRASGGWRPSKVPDSYQGDDQPVVCVYWEQARTFSEWVGGRLPSEAEWEYAARSEGRDRKYPWGDEYPTCKRAAIWSCEDGASAPVCSRPAGNTAQGLCDMAGDDWEWVQDSYHDSYVGAPARGTAWMVAGSSHVSRGGSVYDAPELLRSAYRNYHDTVISYIIGFRPVR